MQNKLEGVCDEYVPKKDEFNEYINSLKPEGRDCENCDYTEGEHRAKELLKLLQSRKTSGN
jgi:hypothetical protein